MIEICRDHAANVKRWQDGQMVLRWIAAAMDEACRQFRRESSPSSSNTRLRRRSPLCALRLRRTVADHYSAVMFLLGAGRSA
jgi:hypothetical protein